jgi:hypothetical protein
VVIEGNQEGMVDFKEEAIKERKAKVTIMVTRVGAVVNVKSYDKTFTSLATQGKQTITQK